MIRRHAVVLAVVVAIIIITAVAVGVAVSRSNKSRKSDSNGEPDYYENGAVATDAYDCSKIGRDVLQDGGHAVDAAIASLICTGVVNLHSTGISGGGFMTVYDRSKKQSKVFDYREYGPASLTPDAIGNDTDKLLVGGLAVGVPGELRGLKKAHEAYGKLNWSRLIQPSIDLARKGTPIGKHMFRYMNLKKTNQLIQEDKGLKEILYKDGGKGKMKGLYDLIVNEKYAKSLEEVAKNFDAINDGSLSQQFVKDVNERNGSITLDDLRNYKVLVKDALEVKLKSLKLTVHTTPLPGGGTVLKHILDMAQGYNFSKSDENSLDKKILLYHRLAEIFKFSYAKRPYLGDPSKVEPAKNKEFEKKVEEIQKSSKAEELRKKINDSFTQKPGFYDPFFVNKEDKGTTHVSVIDKNGNAVAATDTINYAFGAKFRSTKSGIIFNNELGDYFTQNSYKSFFTNTSKTPMYNQPGSGRRPLSSTCPSIITNDEGDVVMVVGGSGGTRITLSTAWVILKKMYLDYTLSDAIDDARVQHAFSPNYIRNEIGYALADHIVDGLKNKGHEIQNSYSNAIIQGIYVDRPNRRIYAKSDTRKEGKASGY